MRIAITGTPGTGKTVVGKLLVHLLGWEYRDLSSLAKEKNLYEGYDKERNVPIVNITAIRKALPKGDCVIESHFAHEIPNDLTVVLRCDSAVLKQRLERRKWIQKKIEENVQAEIFGICLEESRGLKRNILEVDTAKKTPKAVCREILRKIRL